MTTTNEQEDWFHEENRDPSPNGRRTDPTPPAATRAPEPVVAGVPVPAEEPTLLVDPDQRRYEPITEPAMAPPTVNPWEQDTDSDELAPLAIPTTARAPQDAVQIGIWGQPESGKTTYLGALRIAAAQQQGRLGRWTVSGLDDPSSNFLVEQAERMTRQRRFPEPSLVEETLRWSFNGRAPGRFVRRPVEFVLSVQDAPGEAFRQGPLMQRVVDHLARSRGLIYLFDPITLNSSNIEYFDKTLQMLSASLRAGSRLRKGKLPHYLSVCVTKFDDPAFFTRAVHEGWVTQDSTDQRLPRVPDDRAEAFFDWVCHVLRRQGAPLIRELIRSNFDDVRVRYFATSSVGFRLNDQQVFDFRDFRNVDVTADHDRRIREMVRPINVLEPLISLERRIRG
ncbi:hypothetical protein OHA70_29210 [Kribbella sp. NBC_00382]|uniref:hypothetical protein n=1 Tax=Kribbella sp. NBC_00382 TaxID=2975967 RepID=UPI002E1FE842